MKSARIALVLIALGTTAAYAESMLDADADGLVTIEELQAVNPDATAEEFATYDVDASGALDAEELVAATDAGLVPAAE